MLLVLSVGLGYKYKCWFLRCRGRWFLRRLVNKLGEKHVRITGPAASSLPLIILPLITVGATGILMSLILGGPLGWLNQTLLDWVTEMCKNDTNVIILALILGAMIGFDLGGPVNKAAWMAGNALFMSGIYLPSIMINVAICIPPLGYGIATLLRKRIILLPLKKLEMVR